ncbi:hypothetical protein LJC26_02115 [Desulfovibrio sp. OttesenSCG-928-O18]|nr:hypothetical protein [Desulfovibrio sp. OttesenSCG-928-O18]
MNAFSRSVPFRFAVPLLLALVVGLSACATPRQGPALPQVTIGVAEFTQPQSTMDMLAGYMAENTPRVPMKTLSQLDEAFAEVRGKETNRSYAASKTYLECRDAKAPGQTSGRIAALKHWVAVGTCMKVDFLLVPQVMELREREGGEAGVTRPASVIMDIFLIDVKNSVLTSRSHYDETQTALSENLLETGKFFSRGAKWVTAVELAKEGMVKAIKDLGL